MMDGEYVAVISSVRDAGGGWDFTIGVGSMAYTYRCEFDKASAWRVRNLWVAAGLPVRRGPQTVDPNKLVGRGIGVTIEGGYISAVFRADEVQLCCPTCGLA